ncbi:glycosyltransferase [Candidatus Poribacteria bacterium]|nr:glycosyltransferase [Candidatus Poribacteria bacterium]
MSRPRTVIVQNPSIVLTTLACLLKSLIGFNLMVDRHSNFKLETMGSPLLKYKIFHVLSKYTVRKANLTIVTNEFLKELVETWGGRALVLPDKLPSLSLAERVDLPGKSNIAFVCSYSDDEPLDAVIESARLIDPEVVIHVTGDHRKLNGTIVSEAPPNVVFTGFLNEGAYQSLLYSCDAVMVLTTEENLLTCGAYEAVSLGKPMILSNTKNLREYFYRGAIFTENNAAGIAQAVRASIFHSNALRSDVMALAAELRNSWQVDFDSLRALIDRHLAEQVQD